MDSIVAADVGIARMMNDAEVAWLMIDIRIDDRTLDLAEIMTGAKS